MNGLCTGVYGNGYREMVRRFWAGFTVGVVPRNRVGVPQNACGVDVKNGWNRIEDRDGCAWGDALSKDSGDEK